MENKRDEGATPEPPKSNDNCGFGIEGVPPGRKHKFQWVWHGGVMTSQTRCMNCGLVKEAKRRSDEGMN